MGLLWAIFGNNDDPEPPVDYQPGWPLWRRKLWWYARNPLHNLTFYVVGLAGRPFTRVAVYPAGTATDLVFRPEGGWYVAVARYSWLHLPFVSYMGPGFIKKFYIGWRERGNLGAKLTLKN